MNNLACVGEGDPKHCLPYDSDCVQDGAYQQTGDTPDRTLSNRVHEWLDESGDVIEPQPRIPELQFDMEKGTRWTDFIGPAWGYLAFIVAEKVISDFRVASIECFETKPLNITRIPKRLREVAHDGYFVLDPVKSVPWRSEKYGATDKWNISDHRRVIVEPALESSAPIARLADTPTILCHWDMIELARARKWSNVGFHSIDAVDSRPGKRPKESEALLIIDPGSRKWPPERFYSGHHESVMVSSRSQS